MVHTNLYVDESELFKAKRGDLSKSRTIRDNNLRRKVEDLIREYEDATNEFEPALFPEYTVTDVVKYLDRVVHKDVFRLDFPTFCDDVADEKESSSHQAALNYRAAKSSLCAFFNLDAFDISLITSVRMREFESFLKRKYGEDARAVSLYTSHIAAIHKMARLKYNNEELAEQNIKNPFDYYTPPKQTASKHRDVPQSIVQKMINDFQSLKGQQRLAIGAFLLSFATMGMNTPDLFDCERTKGGLIHYYRKKTRSRRSDHAEMFVNLPACVEPLAEEYGNKTKGDIHFFNFYQHYKSYRTMQDAEGDGMRSYKKRIKYAGELTYYSARHTWATIARSNACGIDISRIDECLAHVGTHKVGDIYAKKDFSVFWKDNEKVLAVLDWSPLKLERKNEGIPK